MNKIFKYVNRFNFVSIVKTTRLIIILSVYYEDGVCHMNLDVREITIGGIIISFKNKTKHSEYSDYNDVNERLYCIE